MSGNTDWVEGLPVAITVTDASGMILAMNPRSQETFAADGGSALVGRSVFDCHPEPARTALRDLYTNRLPNHYTIEKQGQRKIIHQIPWYQHGRFAGLVEISVPIPQGLPHHSRD